MRPESVLITPTELCPEPHLWSARDAEASEVEVGDFMFGLVRLVKPKVVLETGCYQGDTTLALVRAVESNGFGSVYSCDTDNTRVRDSYIQCLHSKRLNIWACTGVQLCERVSDVDLAFIDSNGDRLEECKSLQMKKGFVVVHDMNWKSLAPIRELGWNEIFFPTPRGISLFKVN